MLEAISNDCMVEMEDGSGKALVNLDTYLPALKHTGLVEHGFWAKCCAASQVSTLLEDYKAFSCMLADMIKFVFLDHAKFKSTPKSEVSASDLRRWCQLVPSRLPRWTGEDLVDKVKSRLLSVCEAKEKAMFSAGLGAIASVAEQCLSGTVPALAESAQAQLLLKIPKAHQLRALVASFLEVAGSGPVRVFIFFAQISFTYAGNHSKSWTTDLLPCKLGILENSSPSSVLFEKPDKPIDSDRFSLQKKRLGLVFVHGSAIHTETAPPVVFLARWLGWKPKLEGLMQSKWRKLCK